MKTILLKDEDPICIELPEGGDDSGERHIHFVFPAPVCAAELLVVEWHDPSYLVSFEPSPVSLPKLTGLACCGNFAVFDRLLKVIDTPAIEGVAFMGADIRSIPEKLLLMPSLKEISISDAKVPYSVPDEIRNLVNLERFNAEFSPIAYLSPELFRLPHIEHLNFEFSLHSPTPEVLAAADAFAAAGGFLRRWTKPPASKPPTLTDGASLPKN